MPKRGMLYKSPQRGWMFVTETVELVLGILSCFLRGDGDHGRVVPIKHLAGIGEPTAHIQRDTHEAHRLATWLRSSS